MLIEFFTISPQHKNGKTANFILAVPFNIKKTKKSLILKGNPFYQLIYNFTSTNILEQIMEKTVNIWEYKVRINTIIANFGWIWKSRLMTKICPFGAIIRGGSMISREDANLLFWHDFCWKLHEHFKKWTERGHASLVPPPPRSDADNEEENCTMYYIVLTKTQLGTSVSQVLMRDQAIVSWSRSPKWILILQ